MAHRTNARSLPVIEYSEWANAVQSISQKKERPKGYVTQLELADANGWSKGKTRGIVAKLFHAGKLDVIRVSTKRIDGIETTIPAYKLRGGKP